MAVHRNQCRGDYTGTLNAPLLSQKTGVRKPQWCPSILSTKRAPPEKQRTMEAVRSAFHAQLATVMDSLLAAAVCEIAKIFESSLCEQQAELAQKTQEISTLRGKLEKVERMRLPGKPGGAGEEGDRDGESRLRQQSHVGSGESRSVCVFYLRVCCETNSRPVTRDSDQTCQPLFLQDRVLGRIRPLMLTQWRGLVEARLG